MSDTPDMNRRREVAAALLMLLALGVPALLLAANRAWGRVDLPAEHAAEAAPDTAGGALPAAGRVWVRELTPAERDWLMGSFLGAVEAIVSARRPDMSNAPPLCRSELHAPLMVTLYRPAGHVVRRIFAQQPTLAESVRQAAGTAAVAVGGRRNLEQLRVHMTVLRQAVPLGAEQRMSLVQRRFGEPVALGMVGRDGQDRILLPVDAASIIDTTSRSSAAGTAPGLHGEMLEILCKQAGLQPGAWRRADEVPLWLLRVDDFVNAPGTDAAVPGARTLLPAGEIGRDALLRSLRGAVEHLGRSQARDGGFSIIYASGITLGCSSIVLQCETAAAVARAAAELPDEEPLQVALRGVAYAMVNDTHTLEDLRMAYTHRDEPCREVFALEASAQTLAAICRYGLAGGQGPVGNDAMGLMKFLLYMTENERGFHLGYDADAGRPWTPPEHADALVPRARAVVALNLAHRWMDMPEALLAARRGMEWLLERAGEREDAISAQEARWLARAMLEHARHDPASVMPYTDLLARWARRSVQAQIGPGQAPYWDMVGGSCAEYPPTAKRTAQDLIVLLAAGALGADVAGRQEAVDRATRFLLRMQFTETNTYPYADASRRMGAYRRQVDRKLVDLAALTAVLDALSLKLNLDTPEEPNQ